MYLLGLDEGEGEVAQSCPILCDPIVCSLPAFSIHGILQARIMEWVAISFSGGSSDPGIEPRYPALWADSNLWATREAPERRMELEKQTCLTSDYTTKLQSSRQYGTGTKTEI